MSYSGISPRDRLIEAGWSTRQPEFCIHTNESKRRVRHRSARFPATAINLAQAVPLKWATPGKRGENWQLEPKICQQNTVIQWFCA
jgi:hypothetical protein